PDSQGKALNELIKANISEKCGYIDLFSTFREKYNAGEYVYYKTDHHWTAEGAYIAYCEIMKKWGLEKSIIPKESFKFEKIKGFYGTTWSKAGMKFVPPDTMEIWSLGNDDDFVTDCISEQVKKSKDNKRVTVKQKYKSFSGWLNRDYLEKKNKYAAFLDGTHNEQTVFLKSGEKRERLLIVKDSFANTLVPFLAQHFDLVIINLSNNISNATKYANEYECNRVLIVYNFENLTGSNSLAGIK
ncbi:MAG: DHHW family protein, partial [Acutalibacteraceae bacterium]